MNIAPNPREVIGGNNPPGPIDIGKITLADASAWLAENPVIETPDTATEAAAMEKRVKASFDEIEAERVKAVKPLNDQVKAINETHKAAQKPLETARDTIKQRLAVYVRAEEAKRRAEAMRIAREAEEAERIAREAEAREIEAKENSAQGVVGEDVIAATTAADEAFSRFEKIDRAAEIAAKDSKVKVSGGYGRALSLRTVEVLSVTDPQQALQAMGLTANLREAFLTEARAYRKTTGKLPEGITATTEQKL
jgi:hypothetical protein